jgi:KDO2-lipid IV(A) lauroyltransferase
MADWLYSFRASPFAGETTYRLEAEHLEWTRTGGRGRIAFREIERMQVYKERFLGSSASYWANVLRLRSGGRIRLGAAHRAGFRRIEDRTANYIPFVKELEARVARHNPDAALVTGSHWLGRLENVSGRCAVRLVRGLHRLAPRRSGAVLARAMRVVGPRLRGHRTARANLAAAYPDKSHREIENILSGMWDNLGRTIAEFADLDRIWDYDFAQPRPGRIFIDQATDLRLRLLSANPKSALFFTAHLANWEIVALAVPALGRESAMLYRTPNIAVLAEELAEIRRRTAATFIPADSYTVFRLQDAIARGAWIGMLVDQHYASGVDVTFFGRSCKVHPMIARLARTFDCPIYGSRVIRLPDNRFRYELIGPIEAPRDRSGRLDVVQTMQLITSVIEGWIRQNPEQWLWLHRRWR